MRNFGFQVKIVIYVNFSSLIGTIKSKWKIFLFQEKWNCVQIYFDLIFSSLASPWFFSLLVPMIGLIGCLDIM